MAGVNSTDHARAHAGHPARGGLALAALGVVFGDIGTSPLYSLQTVFSINHNEVKPTPTDVYGVISFVFWSITMVVSVKYVAFVMRADNDGEGGILALAALLRGRLEQRKRLTGIAMMLGIVGAALFYGDSMITPAISVMSAIEGISVVSDGFADLVLPIAAVVLTGLFAAQRWGTEKVGKTFGPIMVLWFVTIALLGIPHIVANPAVLLAVLPWYAVRFAVEAPLVAFVAMGAIVLSITGAEALYADMGHFGAPPIRMAWFGLVFPALVLCYMGQGAMILEHPEKATNPFFSMMPHWLVLPMVALATIATVIASQSVISGAFSVSRQATRLGLLPRLTVHHTSKEEGGQVYVPAINWMLYIGVLALVFVFRSSEHLATAYGLAVTGTLLLTTALFLMLAHRVWGWNAWQLWAFAILVGGAEVTFFVANLAKVVKGGWLPLLIAGVVVVVMTTWRAGAALVAERRTDLEGSLAEFLDEVRARGVQRVPGVAVYPHVNGVTTPLALKTNVRLNRVLHEHVVILSIVNENVPHIRHVDRICVSDLGDPDDGVWHVTCRVGFNDSQDIPRALQLAVHSSPPEVLRFDPLAANYFLSVMDVHQGGTAPMPRWRKLLFITLASNAAHRTGVFHLPPDRTVLMGARVNL